jgi:hypothetical protein
VDADGYQGSSQLILFQVSQSLCQGIQSTSTRANMLKLIVDFGGIAEGPAFGDCTKVPIFNPGTIIRPLAGSGAASLIERETPA